MQSLLFPSARTIIGLHESTDRMIGKYLSHYLIEDERSRGGMGIVYRALDEKLDRSVAIKVLTPAALATADDHARFYREAKAAASLSHPNIAIVHAVDESVPEDSDVYVGTSMNIEEFEDDAILNLTFNFDKYLESILK